jgi:hypothetical protein
MPTPINMIFKNLCVDVSIKQHTDFRNTCPQQINRLANLRKCEIFLVLCGERFLLASKIYAPIVTNHLSNAP